MKTTDTKKNTLCYTIGIIIIITTFRILIIIDTQQRRLRQASQRACQHERKLSLVVHMFLLCNSDICLIAVRRARPPLNFVCHHHRCVIASAVAKACCATADVNCHVHPLCLNESHSLSLGSVLYWPSSKLSKPGDSATNG